MDDPESVPPPPKGNAKRDDHFAFHSGVRWFAAEFLVVLTGVLVALALNAWWVARSNRHSEQLYLSQMVADLAAAERSLAATDQEALVAEYAGAKAERSFYMPSPPPDDSVRGWILRSNRTSVPTIPTGTMEALMATGSISQIRNDSLRTHIITYLQTVRSALERQHQILLVSARGSEALESRIAFAELFGEVFGQKAVDEYSARDKTFTLPYGPRRVPYPVDVAQILNDRAVYNALDQMNIARSNLESIRRDMKREATALRTHIERVRRR